MYVCVFVYVYVCTSRSSWVFINLNHHHCNNGRWQPYPSARPSKVPAAATQMPSGRRLTPVSFPPGSPVDSMNKVLQGGGITGFVELLSSTRALRRSQESNDQPRLHLLFFPTWGLFLLCPSFKPPGHEEGPERERVYFQTLDSFPAAPSSPSLCFVLSSSIILPPPMSQLITTETHLRDPPSLVKRQTPNHH